MLLSRTSSIAVAKTIKQYDETGSHEAGKEDPELPLLKRISSLELPASEFAAQINASQSSTKDTSQHQLFRGACVNKALMVKLLQINHY